MVFLGLCFPRFGVSEAECSFCAVFLSRDQHKSVHVSKGGLCVRFNSVSMRACARDFTVCVS